MGGARESMLFESPGVGIGVGSSKSMVGMEVVGVACDGRTSSELLGLGVVGITTVVMEVAIASLETVGMSAMTVSVLTTAVTEEVIIVVIIVDDAGKVFC